MMPSDIFFVIALFLLVLVVVWSVWRDRQETQSRPPAGLFFDTSAGRMHMIVRGRDTGTGLRPIVMVHGSMTNALDMDIELAGRLEAERQVLMPDRLGHGFSARPTDGYRLDVQARAIRNALVAMGVSRPIILGQSYGGAVALRYALDYPDEIAGLVLIAPVAHRWPGGVAWHNRVAINPYYGWLFRRTFIALYGRFGSPRGVARALRGAAFAASYHARTRVGLTFRSAQFRANAEDITRLYEQIVAMDTRYAEIRCPVECLAGTHDMTVISSVHAQGLAKAVPDFRLDIVDGGGHALHHGFPDLVLEAVRRLDGRLSAALASGHRSPLQGALRRLSSLLPRSPQADEPNA